VCLIVVYSTLSIFSAKKNPILLLYSLLLSMYYYYFWDGSFVYFTIIIYTINVIKKYILKFFLNTYLSLHLQIACISLLYFALDSVFNESRIQFFLFIAFSILLGICIIISIISKIIILFQRKNTPLLIAHVIIIFITSIGALVCEVGSLIVAVPVYRSFGSKMVELVGSKPEMIRIYTLYCAFMLMTLFVCIYINIYILL